MFVRITERDAASHSNMRIRKLAIAALIAALPTAAAFAQSALDQSVPRVSPRESPRMSPTDPSTTSQSGNTRGDTRYAGDARTRTCDRSPRHEARCRQRPKTNKSRRHAGDRCTVAHTVRVQDRCVPGAHSVRVEMFFDTRGRIFCTALRNAAFIPPLSLQLRQISRRGRLKPKMLHLTALFFYRRGPFVSSLKHS